MVDAAKERKEAIATFDAVLRKALADQQERAIALLREALSTFAGGTEDSAAPAAADASPGEERSLAQQSLAENAHARSPAAQVFEHAIAASIQDAVRVVYDAGQAMQESGVDASRKVLKAQKATFALKIETTRTASDVQLTNQKLNLEATFEEKLDKKVQEISSNEGALTTQLNERIEVLTEKLTASTVAGKSIEEKLMSTQKELKTAETKVAKFDESMAKLRDEGDQLRSQLEATKAGNATLAAEKESMAASLGEMTSERDALHSQHAEAAMRIDSLEVERDELQQRVDSAVQSHAEEMRQLVEAHATQLAEEVAKAVEIERTEGQAREARLAIQIDALNAKQLELEESLSNAEGLVQESQAEARAHQDALEQAKAEFERLGAGAAAKLVKAEACIAELESALASLRDELESTSKQLAQKTAESNAAGEHLAKLQKHYDEVRAEIEATQAQLKEALKDLNVACDQNKVLGDTNKSLGEQVQELVDRYEFNKKEIEESKAALAAALADLNVERDENMTLGEQIKQLVDKSEAAGKDIASARLKLAAALKEVGSGAEDLSLLVQLDDVLVRFNKLLSGSANERNEIKQLRGELNEANASVFALKEAKALLERQTSGLKEELEKIRAQFKFAFEKIGVLDSDKRQLSEQMDALAKNYKKTLEELDKIRERFTFAFTKINVLNSDKRDLSDQMNELATNYQEVLAEAERIRKELADAIGSVGILTTDKRNLSEQVADLAKGFKEAQGEIKEIKASLTEAVETVASLTDQTRKLNQTKDQLTNDKLSLTNTTGKLSDRVKDLVAKYTDALKEIDTIKMILAESLKGLGVLTNDKRRLTNVEQILSTRLKDLVRSYKDAQTEIGIIKRSFAQSLASIDGLTVDKRHLKVDKRSLSDQVNDLLEAHLAVQEELRVAISEKRAAVAGEEEAIARVQWIRQESINERSRLVQAALGSMQEMRKEVTTTGTRIRLPFNEEHAHAWDDNHHFPEPLKMDMLAAPSTEAHPGESPASPVSPLRIPEAPRCSQSLNASPRLRQRGTAFHSRVSPKAAADVYDRVGPAEVISSSVPPLRRGRLPVLPIGVGPSAAITHMTQWDKAAAPVLT